jgi:pimeloyl-ACP methyl ester carboxylesterase
MELRRVDAGDIGLEVAEAGAGGRPLLVVHGFTGAKEDFTDHVDRLADAGWHVVAPDLRGHGNSDHPSGEDAYGFEVFAADLLALADALGWDRFILLGHSMGGMVAQFAALQAPQRVRALVLMDTSSGPPEGIEREQVDAGADVVREGGMAALCDLQEAQAENDPLATPASVRLRLERPELAETGRRNSLASSPDMWLSMSRSMVAQDDRLDRLTTLDAPVLVIVGEQDRPFVGSSQRMAKAIRGARLAVIPDAGHSPQMENPDAWWAALHGFLAELD